MKKQLLLFVLLLVSNGLLQAIVFDPVLPVKSTSTEPLVELTRPLNTVDTNLKIPFNSGLDVETYFKYIGPNYIPVWLKFNLYAKSKSNPDFGVKLITSQELIFSYDQPLDEQRLYLHADSLKMLTIGSYELYLTCCQYEEETIPDPNNFNKLNIDIVKIKGAPVLEMKKDIYDDNPNFFWMYVTHPFLAEIENVGDTDYNGPLMLIIQQEYYEQIDTIGEKMTFIPAGQTITETIQGSFGHQHDLCKITLLYQDNTTKTKLQPIAPTELSSYEIEIGNPFSLPKNSPDAAINIYPNPVIDWVEIETDTPIQKINITSSQGITIIEQKESGTIKTRVETKSLAPGNYIIQIQTDNSIVSRQFIKY